MSIEIDIDRMIDDAMVEILLDTIPDMTTEELARLEIAINGELQERGRQLDLF